MSQNIQVETESIESIKSVTTKTENEQDKRESIRIVRRLKREVYGEYGMFYYVPMAEAYTVQIPVTVSCSYRKCLFCDLNQNMKFRELPLDEIIANITKIRAIHEITHGSKLPRRFLLAGGNPFVLPTEKLLRIADEVQKVFADCEYISCFARADDILRKTPDELARLRAAGFDRLCIGIESGSDKILAYQKKGVTREQNAAAMVALDAVGIKYSVYIMLGIGGRDMSDEHVSETASLLNTAHPFELTVVTMVLFKGAPLVERVRAHEFKRQTPLESLAEGRELLSRLSLATVWNATHKTNLFPLKGLIPEHKTRLLQRLDTELAELAGKDTKELAILRWRRWGTE